MKLNSIFKILKNMKKKEQSLKFAISSVVLPIMLLCFIAMDAITIFSLIKSMFFESIEISLIVTLGIAVLLEGIPLVIAEYTLKKHKTYHDKLVIISMLILFTTLAAVLTVLRWNTQEIMYDTSHIMNITGNTQGFELTAGNKAMTALLSLEPILTSVIAYAMAYFQSNTEKENDLMSVQKYDLMSCQAELKMIITELEYSISSGDDMIAEDEELYRKNQEEYDAIANELKRRARYYLAEYLENPNDVDSVLQN